MASVNKVILVANLGADPEVRHMTNGDAVCNLRVATTESWKDKQTGEKKEATEWHRVVIYRKLGEIAGEYLKKGSQVYLEGKLVTRKWQDKDGADRYSTEVVADVMQMLGSKGPQQQNADADPPQAKQQAQRSAQGATPNSFDDFSDDIPFICHGHGKAWRVI